MGNCFTIPTQDDLSLLRNGEGGTDANEGTVHHPPSTTLRQSRSASDHHRSVAPSRSVIRLVQSTVQSTVPTARSSVSVDSRAPPAYEQVTSPVYQPNRSTTRRQHGSQSAESVRRQVAQTIEKEKERIKMAKRVGLIQHLPTGIYDGVKKGCECVICMGELSAGDCLRYLPCMHTFHRDCIDDWLMRSFTCPSCMEPVDAGLFMTYYTTTA